MCTAQHSRLRGLNGISWLSPQQVKKLGAAMMMSRVEKRGIIFDDKYAAEYVHILLSGVARITCGNRRGDRTLVAMVAPGVVPRVPPVFRGINGGFRCEAATECEIGTITLESFIDITLGIASAEFENVANSYSGRWDPIRLRGSSFTGRTLEERVALLLLELSESFGIPDSRGVRLTMPTRHQDLADLVGGTRPRITEFLLSFERRELIVREGRQLIVRPDRLQRFVESFEVVKPRRAAAPALVDSRP